MDDWSIASDIPEGRRTPPPPELPPGVEGEAGRYQVIGQLGKGGAGEVFRAIDPLGRQVALKFLSRFEDPQRVQRFLREGRIAASLRHPNIVAIHEAGLSNAQPFLAYELVEGPPFSDALAERTIDERLDLFLEVCEGVAFAHRKGVVHRDLKPDNILVGEDGRPRVADFGLGLAESDQRLTLSGAMVGTPRYMSPEQAQGRGDEHGPASDVWSLGVILYEALTGVAPFQAQNLIELIQEISNSKPTPPRAYETRTPRAVERVCLKALSAKPDDRYSDAGELARALIAARRGSPRGAAWPAAAALTLVAAAVAIAIALRGPDPAGPSPQASSPSKPPLAPAIAAIEQNMKARRYRAALEAADALLKVHPEALKVWLIRGDIFANRGKWPEALECYARATKLDPTSAEAFTGRGLSKAQLGEVELGLADLDRAVGLDPGLADAYEKRSLLHFMRRNYDAALKDAERAVELDPASAEGKNARGVARQAKGDLRGAIHDLEEALALDRHPAILGNLGMVLLRVKRTHEGLRYLDEATSLDPENEATWNALGIAELRAGRTERAVRTFQRALKVNPDYPEALYALAIALRRLGRSQEAAAPLKRLIEKHPEHPDAERARVLLRKLPGS